MKGPGRPPKNGKAGQAISLYLDSEAFNLLKECAAGERSIFISNLIRLFFSKQSSKKIQKSKPK